MRWHSNNELYHYGIKGQKWGVRRYQNLDGTLTEEGKNHYGSNSSEKQSKGKIYEKSIEKASEKVDKLVDEYVKNDFSHPGDEKILAVDAFDYVDDIKSAVNNNKDIQKINKQMDEIWKNMFIDDKNIEAKMHEYRNLSDQLFKTKCWAAYNYSMSRWPKDQAESMVIYWYDKVFGIDEDMWL